jgi:hypothetical protein
MSRKLNDKEMATILHALRVYQLALEVGDNPQEDGCDHFEDCSPLSILEIDTLCESINFESLTLAEGEAK